MNDRNSDRPSRPMVEGKWRCSQCGAEITKLPFEPHEDKLDSLKCLDCFKSNRPERKDRGERRMFEGSWTCADCGKGVTKMPFEPKPGSAVRCIDCYRASR